MRARLVRILQAAIAGRLFAKPAHLGPLPVVALVAVLANAFLRELLPYIHHDVCFLFPLRVRRLGAGEAVHVLAMAAPLAGHLHLALDANGGVDPEPAPLVSCLLTLAVQSFEARFAVVLEAVIATHLGREMHVR